MTSKRIRSLFLFLAMSTCVFLLNITLVSASLRSDTNIVSRTQSFSAAALSLPDYDSGWINLQKATLGSGSYPPVYPADTSLAHNLETYDVLVQVLAADVSGNYVQVPNPIIGSGSAENNWFLTSPNQILLRNWDASRTVPVRVMMWKLSALVQATFSQTGVSPNFTGTVLTVDGSSYGVADLPISFSFDIGSSHIFSFASPLIEGSKQYVWNSTSGLSALQNGALTMNTSGSIVGNYLQQDVKVHNVAISNISSSQSVIVQGYSGHLTLTVQNLGSFNEDFNVTVYANSTIINTLNLNLLNGSTMTQNLLWNTTGFAYGNYKISAYAWPVPGETDYTDNNFTSSWIISLIEGQNLPQFYCDEYSFSTSSASINSTFKVEIRVANWSAPGVIGYEFSLTYDNTMLEAVAAEIPTGHWFTPTIKPSNFFPVDSGTIDQTAGRVKFAAALLAPELGKTGSGVVADVTFRILKSPSADETISCDLGLSNVIMVNPSAQVISPSNYTILDGRFVFAWASQLRTDLNGDRAVNIVDISIAARAVFTQPGDPGWNAAADLNDDGTINVIDIVIIAKDYGRTY